jgi:MFS family permease
MLAKRVRRNDRSGVQIALAADQQAVFLQERDRFQPGGSLLMGGSANWGPGWTLLLVSIGSFFILGDSGVLSAAMADNVPPQQLGSVMGWRSLLGFGIGSFAPFSFGVVMDTTHSWGASYAVLACGGGVACLAACLLWRQHLK